MKESLNPIVPFICVNYGTYTETVKYIENVIGLKFGQRALIIVIDNTPDEFDFNKLLEYKEENHLEDAVLKIIRDENRGYFQGLNVGVKYARSLNNDSGYYVVGNNDIIFEDDFIKYILDYQLDSDTLIICPDVITTEGSHENPHVLRKMGFLRKLKYQVYYSNYFIAKILSTLKSTERRFKRYDSQKKNIHMGIGALYILTPNFFKHFDFLWEDVFLYGEEAILAGQVGSVNGKILYDPSFVCYHNESSTTSKIEPASKYKIVQQSYKVYKKYL
ncbi:glycosyltransferase [Sphingobacterium sp. SYP-B4668]|uniref:glycosyltransferase n=1 Tax=Sphingobacterium sp. SYP-B4668 TaxID=2996035 RepID=UPI0022DE9507|nr:glycosyltransferase [Sphingobacterium sp. SYP-B4668]